MFDVFSMVIEDQCVSLTSFCPIDVPLPAGVADSCVSLVLGGEFWFLTNFFPVFPRKWSLPASVIVCLDGCVRRGPPHW